MRAEVVEVRQRLNGITRSMRREVAVQPLMALTHERLAALHLRQKIALPDHGADGIQYRW